MVSVCFYFQVHQPLRLRNYTVFDVAKSHDYFDENKNVGILRKVTEKCYLPTNKLILDLIEETDGRFKVAYSMSGVVLEQLERYAPEVIDSFKQLVKTGAVEILDETYHHSLSFFYSKKEFKEQVRLHRKKVRKLFGCEPRIFRNTELIYNNELAEEISKMGYKGVLAEGADHVLGWRSPNFLYTPINSKIKLLLKNYKLSDDIAFRFSTRSWKEWPLTAPKFARWINATNGSGNVVNLFMDYETFGEHQWKDTGIFDFLKALPKELLKHPDNDFKTPYEVVKAYKPVGELDVPFAVSWADVERDMSAWLGNRMQQEAIKKLYELEKKIKKTKDKKLLADWRSLQTGDHFYYMCTKWFADGDVHKYFNPYDSPYECFIIFMNVLKDLESRVEEPIIINTKITKN